LVWITGKLSDIKRQGFKTVEMHLNRFDVEYFPIKIDEHISLLNSSGFRVVEIFWRSYMQAGFYCIK